jgi:addiction module HigA family antidote
MRFKANALPANRRPTHPGEILLEDFLKPLGISQVALAKKLGIPVQRVNTIVAGKRGITAETALLFARFFETTPQLWMNLQNACDLWAAQRRLERAG